MLKKKISHYVVLLYIQRGGEKKCAETERRRSHDITSSFPRGSPTTTMPVVAEIPYYIRAPLQIKVLSNEDKVTELLTRNLDKEDQSRVLNLFGPPPTHYL